MLRLPNHEGILDRIIVLKEGISEDFVQADLKTAILAV